MIVTPEKVPTPLTRGPVEVHVISRTKLSAAWVRVIESFTTANVPAISALKPWPPLKAEDAGKNNLPEVVPSALNVIVRVPPTASTSSVTSPDTVKVVAA